MTGVHSGRNCDWLLAVCPLIPPVVLLIPLLQNPIPMIGRWLKLYSGQTATGNEVTLDLDGVGSQLLAYVTVALLGFIATDKLVPHIKKYTLRKGITGKDLGKRGTPTANTEM
jgi:hypothetical protein